MVKPIMKDIFFLGQKSEEATRTDLQVGKDLEDTLEANREGCVGMAANMIGVRKRVIIVNRIKISGWYAQICHLPLLAPRYF